MDGVGWPRTERGRLMVMAHSVFAGRIGGAEHMVYNLVHGLQAGDISPKVVCAAEINLDPGFVAAVRARDPDVLRVTGGGDGSRFLAEQRACLLPAMQADATLFPNYFVPPIVPRRLGRVAAVIHDLQYRTLPEHFSAKKRAWLTAALALTMRRAETVIAISNFVRDELQKRYGSRLGSKVITIPNPISWARFGEGISRRPLDRPYVLSVAAQYAHKNLEVLIRAFATIARSEPDLMLVFCGQDYAGLRGVPGSRSGLAQLADELGLRDRVQITGYVDDVALGAWYRHAALFAFPSLYEGFGMPPVEALGLGLPTVTSRGSALAEVTRGFATYIENPRDVAEWAATIRAVARDPGLFRPDPRDVGHIREFYSPELIGRLYASACLGIPAAA